MRSTLACQLALRSAGRPGSCSMARPSLVLVVEPLARFDGQGKSPPLVGVGGGTSKNFPRKESAMDFHESVIDAVDRVLSWDLPDEALPDAVSAEASYLVDDD